MLDVSAAGPMGHEASIQAELAAIFKMLNAAGVRWCVLRLPHSAARGGGDVDLLVDQTDMRRFRACMRPSFVEVPGWGDDSHFVHYVAASDTWLWLHVVTELNFGKGALLRTNSADGCLQRRCRSGPWPTLSAEDEFWVLLLHCILDKRGIPVHHRDRLARLSASARTNTQLARCFAAACGPESSPQVAVDRIRLGDWERVASMGTRLLKDLERHRPVFERVMRVLRSLFLRVRYLPRHRGITVAILGPDGAGKSTLQSGICDRFMFPVHPMYMGLTGGLLRVADRLWFPPLIILARLAILWGRYLTGQYHLLHGRVVVFDRYTYDAVAPTPYPLSGPARLWRFLEGRACPAPDLVLLLDAPGALMHARKREYTPLMLEDWRQRFLTLAGRVRHLEVIDATRPLEEVRTEAISHIWRRYVARLEGRTR